MSNYDKEALELALSFDKAFDILKNHEEMTDRNLEEISTAFSTAALEFRKNFNMVSLESVALKYCLIGHDYCKKANEQEKINDKS